MKSTTTLVLLSVSLLTAHGKYIVEDELKKTGPCRYVAVAHYLHIQKKLNAVSDETLVKHSIKVMDKIDPKVNVTFDSDKEKHDDLRQLAEGLAAFRKDVNEFKRYLRNYTHEISEKTGVCKDKVTCFLESYTGALQTALDEEVARNDYVFSTIKDTIDVEQASY